VSSTFRLAPQSSSNFYSVCQSSSRAERTYPRGDRAVLDGGNCMCAGIPSRKTNHTSVRPLSRLVAAPFLRIPRSDLKPDNILISALGHAHLTGR
jgi:hypothetical protein